MRSRYQIGTDIKKGKGMGKLNLKKYLKQIKKGTKF